MCELCVDVFWCSLQNAVAEHCAAFVRYIEPHVGMQFGCFFMFPETHNSSDSDNDDNDKI
jgi:hypothetical protein